MKKETLSEFIHHQFNGHVYFVNSFRETYGVLQKVYFRGDKKYTGSEMYCEIEKDRDRRTKNILKFLTGLQHINLDVKDGQG